MSKILFISEMKSPLSNRASSTTIMVNNMIMGLKACGYMVEVIAIGDYMDKKDILDYYSDKVDKILFFESKFCKDGVTKKYQSVLKIFYNWIISFPYRKIVRDIAVGKNDIIVTHSPSIESIIYAKFMLKKGGKRYIQFWSDPIALSGIYPEEIGAKRKLFLWLEHSCIKTSNEIVYGTRTLLDFQKKIFPDLAEKMRYVDVGYNWNIHGYAKKISVSSKIKYGYFGNYYSDIRDIYPLYETFKNKGDDVELTICGSSDLKLRSTSNVLLRERVSPNEADKIEDTMDVIVCILNKHCVQIPGKLFYKTCLPQIILVILDGKYQDVIKEDLKRYNRFIFCANTEEDIERALYRIKQGEVEKSVSRSGMISSKEMAEQLMHEMI